MDGISLHELIKPEKSVRGVDVEFFDPPMCCPTGICGPTIDQTLLDVSDMVMNLQKAGFQVERYQMTSHPHAFLNNSEVMRLVREKQMAALPVVVVRGKILCTGSYPKMIEIEQRLKEAK